MNESTVLWTSFNAFVLGMLALDLGVFTKVTYCVRARGTYVDRCLGNTCTLFNLFVYFYFGEELAVEFLPVTSSKSLSVDNIL